MTSVNNFLDKENVQLLWEVLIDEPLIKQLCTSETKKNNLIRIFESNLNDFFISERYSCTNLIELNKKYIFLIVNAIMKITTPNARPVIPQNNNVKTIPETQQYRKIKIHPEEPKQSITYEDIHNDRIQYFEKEYNKKQEEFTNAMTLPVPPVPNFSDNVDEPTNDLESEIKKIQEQRNYDIEVINNNWLKSQETSIKNEKFAVASNKHISWKDENVSEEINIFDKFKKITNNDLFNEVINDKNTNTQQMEINEIKKEIVALNEKLDLILQKLNN
jgi:hypothetical protein